MKVENVNVLEVSDDKGTIQFRENDVVEILYEIFKVNEENEMNDRNKMNIINEISKISKKCLGRINFIDTNDVEIDASKEYESNIENIRYKDIKSIKLIKRKNN